MPLEESDFRFYKNTREAFSNVDVFRGDWFFHNVLGYAAVHKKTGLQMCVVQTDVKDEEGNLVETYLDIASKNMAEWESRMKKEGLSEDDMKKYQKQLAREFKVLLKENDRKVGKMLSSLSSSAKKFRDGRS
ncbi:MAG: hypothetical protein J5896_04460 [Alphaproteobacteria bacterium]|nr:hypothetical protein [Alphaproteobacteria bacterium]